MYWCTAKCVLVTDAADITAGRDSLQVERPEQVLSFLALLTSTKVQMLRLEQCSVYLRYWYKNTNTATRAGAQFPCFSGTKVQILTPPALVSNYYFAEYARSMLVSVPGAQFTCFTRFTSTIVGAQFICFTGTKVQGAQVL